MIGYKFVQKPKEVLAIPWLGDNAIQVREFCKYEDGTSALSPSKIQLIKEGYHLVVDGNEVDIGEWIVKSGDEFIVVDAIEFEEQYVAANG